MGFHWRIFLLSRANRFYAIFNTGLKNLGPSCPQIFFCLLHPEYLAFWFCLLRTLPNNWLSYFLFPLMGRSPYLRFRVSANHLASPSFPLPVSGDLRLLITNICWYPLCDLHSFLTVTFLTGCHCSFQREDSINLISIVSVGYHVTICTDFKSYKEWSNIHFSAPTTIILTTKSNFHILNYFGHMIHAPQTNRYQNITILLTHPCTIRDITSK